ALRHRPIGGPRSTHMAIGRRPARVGSAHPGGVAADSV
ncbi:MAG: hypothetical protein AVDCRST_MAG17-2144, partial [uncultured Solirubrobacterales bacterium]